MRRHGTALVIIVFVVLAASSTVPVPPVLAGSMEPYGMANYCQVPPFVVSNIIPNIMILSSNSASMLKFAYASNDNCSSTSPCGGFVDNMANPYYGYFDSRYWYSYSSNRFTPTAPKLGAPGLDNAARLLARTKGSAEWDGNFLNWLTMRRIDALRRALTGGNATAGILTSQIADTAARGTYKTVLSTLVDINAYGPSTFPNNRDLLFTFTTGGASTAPSFTVASTSAPAFSAGPFSVNVDVVPGTAVEGVIQTVIGAKARLGLTFFNSDNQGGSVDPPPGFTSLSSVVNRINTPANINGGASEPLAEALYTIAGFYAQSSTTSGAGGLGISPATCLNNPSSICNPLYHGGDYSTNVSAKDPYNYGSGGIVRYAPCAKSFVVIIADGEPCGDGAIPTGILDNTSLDAYRYTGSIPDWCGLGGNVPGVESVALWAHTNDLRSATIGKNSIDRMQNLTIYVVQAFGSGSGILRQTAINGAFEDADGSRTPNHESEYNTGAPGNVDAFYEANNGAKLEKALLDIFSGILKRASSGTAASVLASGEGSGANLVQAIFYPRRRFGNDVITWTGSLQNLWYYVDPYLGNAAIHEDTVGDDILALDNDYLARFLYDTLTDTTKVQLIKTDLNGSIDNTVAPVTKSFEEIKSLWEAGGGGTDRTGMLHLRTTGSRVLFTIDNTATDGRREFIAANYTYLNPLMGVPDLNGLSYFGYPLNWDETAAVIQYVRGTDDVSIARPRTVVVGTDNSVWKLGDIIHSTPRIAGRTPLNSYYKVYADPTYKAFTDNASSATSYANRGTVFAGGNDGMLHAFKLGKLEFSGLWQTSFGRKAKLVNLDGTTPLGYEKWGYIPKNALPYLKFLTDTDYCHLYYVDLSPVIFDASIWGNPDDVKTSTSWRTILIGGMGTGGASRTAAGTCNGGTSDCVKAPAGVTGGLSSYFAIDITNPDAPKVLWEFADARLGFATTGPAIVKVNYKDPVTGVADRTRNGHWFVVLGSGPTGPIDNTYNQFLARSDQPLRLFVLDLKTGALRTTIDNTGISNAFAGSMLNAAADFDLDYQDDALFFGYVKKDSGTGTWTNGGVGRLTTKGDKDPTRWVFSPVIDGIGPVTSSVVRLQNNIYRTNWLFFGTGRYYYELGSEIDDADGARSIYGIKDPCFKSGNTYPDCTAAPVNPSDLRNVTLIADVNTNESVTNAPDFPGWYINLASDNTTAIDYGDGAHYYHAEREITDPLSVTSTGTVFFTTYRPYNEFCALGGKSFIWAVRYNTGGAPTHALAGKALIQVSTASVEQLDLSGAFSGANSQGGRKSAAIEGVPPIAQGLSILTAPPPTNKVLHMIER